MPRAPRGPRAKHWCFTFNNPDINHDAFAALFTGPSAYDYLIFQSEIGTQGTPHYQGYVELKARTFLKTLKEIHPSIHWEKRLGSREQARDYAQKIDTRAEGPYEYGTWNDSAQGTRTDLIDFVAAIRNGASMDSLADQNPVALLRYSSSVNRLRTVLGGSFRPCETQRRVTLLYGPPGVGKTYTVCTEARTTGRTLWARSLGTGLWFDGYDKHDIALLDEFKGAANHFSLSDTLRILDQYDQQVPIKGSFTWWTPSHIFISTNTHPRDWYDYSARSAEYLALRRRFTDVVWWKSSDRLDKHILQRGAVEDELRRNREGISDDWTHFWNYMGDVDVVNEVGVRVRKEPGYNW